MNSKSTAANNQTDIKGCTVPKKKYAYKLTIVSLQGTYYFSPFREEKSDYGFLVYLES